MRNNNNNNNNNNKDNPAPSPPQPPKQLQVAVLCLETKPLVATFLALTLLLMLVWTFPSSNYYPKNLLSTTTTTSSSPLPPDCSALPILTHPSTDMTSSTSPLPFTATAASDRKFSSASTIGNSSSSSSSRDRNVDPNRRTFQAYGNAAALFVQMGAYRGGPSTFAVVGLASKPTQVFGRPWYKCEWMSNNKSKPNPNMKAKAYKMLPDWGYGRVYTVVVVNCSFPANPNEDNAGGKLVLYAFYGESQRRYEKFTALEETAGSYNHSRYSPPYDYDYLYCGSSLYGNLSALRIREWLAYHAWFFGPRSHFVLHDAGGVSPEVRKAIEPWERAGRVTVQDIRGQAEFDGYYYNQFLVVNDCLHRYRHSANWTFYFDVDEYMYLPDGNTLQSVLANFSDYTQFTIEQNPMSSVLCFNDSSRNYSREWGFEKLVFRESRTGIRRDRKYAIQAKNAYATGVHMSENVIGKTLHQTETMIRYYHYHNSITVREELCREFLPLSAHNNVTWYQKLPYVYDDNMMKLAPTIKQFERNALLHVHHHPSSLT